jgi:hypothetical protein
LRLVGGYSPKLGAAELAGIAVYRVDVACWFATSRPRYEASVSSSPATDRTWLRWVPTHSFRKRSASSPCHQVLSTAPLTSDTAPRICCASRLHVEMRLLTSATLSPRSPWLISCSFLAHFLLLRCSSLVCCSDVLTVTELLCLDNGGRSPGYQS